MSERARTICLVACAKAKLERAAPARELYVSQLFRAARRFAERCADEWLILSAHHGVLEPNSVIKPYNVTLNKMSVERRRRWAAGVCVALTERVRAGDTIIFIAGKHYRRFVTDELRERGLLIRVPLEGLGIGLQLQALKRMTEERGS